MVKLKPPKTTAAPLLFMLVLLLSQDARSDGGQGPETCSNFPDGECPPEQGDDGPSPDVRHRAEAALGAYAKLHPRLLDKHDTASPPKRFLLLQPLLGMGNSMIEEATALLIALETGRALTFDLFDRSMGQGKAWHAPSSVYARPINTDKEQLIHFASASQVVDTLPERREHLYAQFNEFVGCADWNQLNKSTIVATMGRFLGYPPAYGNGHGHGRFVRETFGEYFFYFASRFLHTPKPSIQKKVDKIKSAYVDKANCSVGIHIRWGAPDDSFHYVDHGEPEEALMAYVRCASSLCDAGPGTVWMLATDSEWVRWQVRKITPQGVRLWHSKLDVQPDNSNHASALSEMLLIGSCNHMVTTRLSTFSFASHARSLKRPWVVGKGDPVCRRAESSQQGLFVGEPVHERWPWQPGQLQRVSCGENWPQSEGGMRDFLAGKATNGQFLEN